MFLRRLRRLQPLGSSSTHLLSCQWPARMHAISRGACIFPRHTTLIWPVLSGNSRCINCNTRGPPHLRWLAALTLLALQLLWQYLCWCQSWVLRLPPPSLLAMSIPLPEVAHQGKGKGDPWCHSACLHRDVVLPVICTKSQGSA